MFAVLFWLGFILTCWERDGVREMAFGGFGGKYECFFACGIGKGCEMILLRAFVL